MATLTIRNLDDQLKQRLRLRAAAQSRSMEEEARQILRAALQKPAPLAQDLGARIHARFAALGGASLPIETRDPLREPTAFEASEPSPAPPSPDSKRP